ncbi:Protein of unknown function [Micromonospora lupini str. Lupac 08]|uniref:HPr kinase n=2 Tax=Micromonospora lupini TaxID=285679 RepID=I0L4S0_9ACTN|nr:Protein of unknown function [Micromonospora lupini str. Lupac 08]
MPTSGRAAYGLRVHGLDEVADLPPADDAAPGWPAVRIRQCDTPPPPPVPLDDRRGTRILADGRTLAVDREHGTATFYGPPLTPDVLAHPYLAPVATTVNRWAGRETFHSGAFVLAGRAWAVLGPRTAGKSSLLAALAARDVPVLTDDILVTDGVDAFAGPRCVDLRQPVPGVTLPSRRVRAGDRLRVGLPPIAPRVPLGGWLFLRWGAVVTLTRLPQTVLLARLAGLRSFGELPSDPVALLSIAALPGWDLTRPRDWAALDDTHRLVAEAIAASRAVGSAR